MLPGEARPRLVINYTVDAADTAPPAGITDLQNSTYAHTYINWTWADPADADLSKVMVYLNGTFKTNLTKGVQFYNATALTPDTVYTISTHTVDTSGNVNQTWRNNTARTATYDIDGNGAVNILDSYSIVPHLGESYSNPPYSVYDVNRDGNVTPADIDLVGEHFDR